MRNKNWRFGDIYVSWYGENQDIIAKRYYHLFTKKELIKIVKSCNLEMVNLMTLGGKNKTDNIFLLLRNNH